MLQRLIIDSSRAHRQVFCCSVVYSSAFQYQCPSLTTGQTSDRLSAKARRSSERLVAVTFGPLRHSMLDHFCTNFVQHIVKCVLFLIKLYNFINICIVVQMCNFVFYSLQIKYDILVISCGRLLLITAGYAEHS